MSDVVFQGNADFASVEKAFQSMAKENLRLLQQVTTMAATNNRAAGDDRKNKQQQIALAREATAMLERHRGPMDRYNEGLAKARDHLAANRISGEIFRAEKQRLQGVLQQEVAATTQLKGSYQALEKELKDNIQQLQRLPIGTKEFATQKTKVDQLRTSLDAAKSAMSEQHAPIAKSNDLLAKGGDWINSSIKQIAGMAAGYLSVQQILQAVNAELAKKTRIQKEAAGQTRTLEMALADAMPNIAAEDRPKFRQMVREDSLRLGVHQKDYANVAGIAISAGAGDLDRAAQIIEQLMLTTAGNSEAAIALGQAALDFTALAGSDNIEGAIGQMAAAMGVARATRMTEYASNVAPSMAAATAGGNNVDAISVERGLEVAGVLNNLLKDTTGNWTATALNQLISKMESFVPEMGQRETLQIELRDAQQKLARQKPGTQAADLQQQKVTELQERLKAPTLTSLSPDQIDKFRQVRNFDERLQMLRGNATLAQQFVAELKEGKLKNSIREFVQGTDRALNEEARQQAAIPSMDQGMANFENLKSNVQRETAVLRSQQRNMSIEEYYASDGTTPLIGQAKQIFEDTLSSVDLPGLDSFPLIGAENALKLALKKRSVEGENPIDVMIDLLQKTDTEGFRGARMDPADLAKVQAKIGELQKLRTEFTAKKVEQQAAAAVTKPAAAPAPVKPPAAAQNTEVRAESAKAPDKPEAATTAPVSPAAAAQSTDVRVESPKVELPPVADVKVYTESPQITVPEIMPGINSTDQMHVQAGVVYLNGTVSREGRVESRESRIERPEPTVKSRESKSPIRETQVASREPLGAKPEAQNPKPVFENRSQQTPVTTDVNVVVNAAREQGSETPLPFLSPAADTAPAPTQPANDTNMFAIAAKAAREQGSETPLPFLSPAADTAPSPTQPAPDSNIFAIAAKAAREQGSETPLPFLSPAADTAPAPSQPANDANMFAIAAKAAREQGGENPLPFLAPSADTSPPPTQPANDSNIFAVAAKAAREQGSENPLPFLAPSADTSPAPAQPANDANIFAVAAKAAREHGSETPLPFLAPASDGQQPTGQNSQFFPKPETRNPKPEHLLTSLPAKKTPPAQLPEEFNYKPLAQRRAERDEASAKKKTQITADLAERRKQNVDNPEARAARQTELAGLRQKRDEEQAAKRSAFEMSVADRRKQRDDIKAGREQMDLRYASRGQASAASIKDTNTSPSRDQTFAQKDIPAPVVKVDMSEVAGLLKQLVDVTTASTNADRDRSHSMKAASRFALQGETR